ncbi:PCRF domain-containing protein, partial [Escherichia coli]|uniref:PCRF domain-containing protein n=1 Tax=Escherichia coli TaxID=562 RepID=UPI0028DF9358
GIFDYDLKKERLEEVLRELEDPTLWNDPKKAQDIGRERTTLEGIVVTIDKMTSGLVDARDLLDLAVEEDDEGTLADVSVELDGLEKLVADL